MRTNNEARERETEMEIQTSGYMRQRHEVSLQSTESIKNIYVHKQGDSWYGEDIHY